MLAWWKVMSLFKSCSMPLINSICFAAHDHTLYCR
jgi:hypothetical protein